MPPDPASRPQPARRPEPEVTPRRRAAAPRRRPPDPADDGPLVPGTGLPILRAQRDAGNAAVVGALAGQRRDAAIAPARVAVQRNVPPPRPSKGIPDDYDTMSDADKVAVIRDLVAREPGSVYTAWKKLGNPLAVARANPDLFTASMKIDDDIVDLAAFDALREDFKSDVLEAARSNLAKNLAGVRAEKERTGVDVPEGQGTPEQTERVQEVQQAAEQMTRVKDGKAKALATQIGWRHVYGHGHVAKTPVMFDPAGMGSGLTTGGGGLLSWETVNEKWKDLLRMESAIVREAPSASYFINQGDPTALGTADVKGARAMIANALGDIETRILDAQPKVGDDLGFDDFVPIHAALMTGMPGPATKTTWSKPVERAVAKETVSDASTIHLLQALGVGTLSAAAFILAEIFTGGLATAFFVVGAGVSVTQAGMSIDKALDLAAANKASIDPLDELVSAEQVDSAIISAVLDSVFAVLDVGAAAKGINKVREGGKLVLEGAQVGAKASARVLLKGLDTAPNKAELVSRALAELGPEATQKAAGRSYEDLAKIVGEGTSAGARFLELAKTGGKASEATRALLEKLPKIAELDAVEGEQVLRAAVETKGYIGALESVGGWGALRKMEAMKGATGKAMEEWRVGIVKELEEYVARESEEMSKAVRTGTEAATSDLDVQVVGGAAAELQQKAEGWLSQRVGMNVKKSKKLLDAEIFVDPSRAHLIDLMRNSGISQEIRDQISAKMADFEKKAIFGARYKQAKAISQEAAQKVLDEAEAAGVKDIFMDFEKMSAAAQKATSAQIDGWMKELSETTDAAKKAALVERISKAQALINASHGDAYVGGGVRVWVTGREEDVKKLADALGIPVEELASATNQQRIVAAIGEGKWLDAAVETLSKGGQSTEAVTKAITDAGKHGSRAATVLKAAGAPNAARLEVLADWLKAYKAMTAEEIADIIAKGDLGRVRNEIFVTLDMLRDSTSKAIRALEGEAKAAGVSAAEMTAFQDWLRWQNRYAAVVSGVKSSTWAVVRELEAFASAGTQQSINQPPETQSIGPAPVGAPP